MVRNGCHLILGGERTENNNDFEDLGGIAHVLAPTEVEGSSCESRRQFLSPERHQESPLPFSHCSY